MGDRFPLIETAKDHRGSPCRSVRASECPGPPESLPGAHRDGLTDHDHGWEHLDRCGSCRVTIRTCGWRTVHPCDAARRAFQYQAAQVTVRAQGIWAKKMGGLGESIDPQVLSETTELLYLKALRKLAGYDDDKLASERAAFSTYWVTFLIKNAGDFYWAAAADVKPDRDFDSAESSLSVERAIIRPAHATLEPDLARSVVDHVRRALTWLDSLTGADQRLVIALLCLRVTLKAQPSNSDVYQALYGSDTAARAGAQRVRRHLYERQGDVPPVSQLLRDGLLPMYLGIGADVRSVITHLVVETVRELPSTGVPSVDQFVDAITRASALLEVRTAEQYGERTARPDEPTRDPTQTSGEEEL